MLLLMTVLGMVFSVSGCTRVIYQPIEDPYPTTRVITGTERVYYENGRATRCGTVVKHYPKGLYWRNMYITWTNRYNVQVCDSSGQVIDQFNLRIKQDVERIYYPTGVNGQSLKVKLFITGGEAGVNFIKVQCGNDRFDELYELPTVRDRYIPSYYR